MQITVDWINATCLLAGVVLGYLASKSEHYRLGWNDAIRTLEHNQATTNWEETLSQSIKNSTLGE